MGVQAGDQESQGTAGAELGWGRERQQETFLQVHRTPKKDERNCTRPEEQNGRPGYNRHGEGRGTQQHFALVLTGKCFRHATQLSESKGRDGGNEVPPTVGGGQVRDHLRDLHVHKCVGPDEMHPRVLKELSEEVAKPLSIRSEKSWPLVTFTVTGKGETCPPF